MDTGLTAAERIERIARWAASFEAVAAAGSTSAAPVVVAGPADFGMLVGDMQRIQSKLDEVKEALKGAIDRDTRETVSAVKGLSGLVIG